MKRVIFAALVLMVSITAMGQETMDDGSRVILPLEVQQCDLPSAPAPIPGDPIKEDLLKAQKNVKLFQAEMVTYRTCINQDTDSDALTSGNRLAITNAYNYTVDMEERVAQMFNEAVRAFNDRQAKN